MEAIGGYFELELPLHEEYHKDAIRLNTGRNCLEYILRCRKYKKVYIPYYTCEVILEPFQKLNVNYQFYHINLQFEIGDDICLASDEALLYTNYYGLKQRYVEKLAKLYGSQLIVDNTQAFYARPIEGIDSFYTCRKFFGVPDGAYLYTDEKADFELERDVSYDRMLFLLKRIEFGAEAGYADFRESDDGLVGQPMKSMSKLTVRLMQSIDYGIIDKRRRNNYIQLHEALFNTNLITLKLEDDAVPMVYPYYAPINGLREKLIENKVFVAKYWPNVRQSCNYRTEYELANRVVSLPCDQRYDIEEMDRIISIINTL